MRFDSRIAAVALAAAVLASPAVPGLLGEPARRLVNVDADGPDPLWDRPLDADRLRAFGERLPDDATYAVRVRQYDPVLAGNLKAGAQLFLAPSLPVQDPGRADWLIVADGSSLQLVRR